MNIKTAIGKASIQADVKMQIFASSSFLRRNLSYFCSSLHSQVNLFLNLSSKSSIYSELRLWTV